MRGGTPLVIAAAVAAFWAVEARAQQPEAPRRAGVDVPAPVVRKKVDPVIPAEVVGVSGIVIVEIVIDEDGSVTSAELVRSIPALDSAALEAVRQWKFEPTRVDGKPVKVRHVVALTFSRRLPDITRQKGIPELRQGAAPAIRRIAGAPPSVQVVADLTLAADGSVLSAEVTRGDRPFSDALLAALKTWRFAPGDPNVVLSFRAEATFLDASGGSPRVQIHLTGLRRSESTVPPPEASAATGAPAAAPALAQPAAPSQDGAPPAGATADMGSTTPPANQTQPAAAPAQDVVAANTAGASPADSQPAAPLAPEVEVINPAAEPAAPPRSTEPGVSAVADVVLGPGVPDLVTGRRPVVPPLARMHVVSGQVEVRFSVDGAGKSTVHEVSGPDLLKPQADQAVRTWVFRRTTLERVFLTATFTYEGNKASASVAIR